MDIDKTEFLREIILSKAKGELSIRGFELIYELSKFINSKFNYDDKDIRYDVLMSVYLHTCKSYKNFNEHKYKDCLPFFTEVIKRSHTNSYLKVSGLKRNMDITFVNYFFNL